MIYILIAFAGLELVAIVFLLKSNKKNNYEKQLELEKELSKIIEESLQEIQRKKEESWKEIQSEKEKSWKEINEEKEKQLNSIKSEESTLRSNLSAQAYKDFEEKKILYLEKIENLDKELEEYKKNKSFEKEKFDQTIQEIEKQVEVWKQRHDSVIESFKRMEEIESAENYYKIFLSPEELQELAELNQVIKKLKNPMPFYKAVYDIYYKKKVGELVLRVIGPNRVSGIYKITDIQNGKCYVGQSVDIAERWKQHCKRGSGADVITRNKLYPVMLEKGIHNFMFEILETTTDTSKLSAMETYWQDFYQAKSFGYSIN